MAISLKSCPKTHNFVDIHALCDEAEQKGEMIYQQVGAENHFNLTPNIPEIKDNYTEISGCNYLYHLPSVTEFEDLFGTTVFGYLHKYRMERSRQLSAMGEMRQKFLC